ncbi:MAG: formylglycine-generating enzyme family protein [Verrucomicrobiota bacterium]|nr:formylglycine-generating enzyme family protein [Verrucomicrobiota bacterium]
MLSPVSFPIPLPDDPRKWDGWSRYNSADPYERLCLDPQTNPSNQLIEERFRDLLLWWQKKLPLKNQPSNPLAQLLRSGLDESSRFLTEARVELLDPERRRQLDEGLAAQAEERAIAEFNKYLFFALNDKTLSLQEEETLLALGRQHGLSDERMVGQIEAELEKCGGVRVTPPSAEEIAAAAAAAEKNGTTLDPQEDFMRMLRLSGLDADDMTDDQRDAFVNMAENLGIEPGDAEDMVDRYLEEIEEKTAPPPPKPIVIAPKVVSATSINGASESVVVKAPSPMDATKERAQFANFTSGIGTEMLLVPTGSFQMGSNSADAAPNERPITPVALSRYYLSRHPITNAQYEMFDPSHSRKRAPKADDRHPVVYVSSTEATKFCQWLSAREKRRYRLPTEAEWEYAARGADGRKYPWGNQEGRGDLANFADRNTVFAWSDREIDDGFPESSPVGSFPRGASPFGMEDMAGNVWEWCLDFMEAYRGTPKTNPRGAISGQKRVYRGGSWKSRFNSLRTTTRGANVSNYTCNDLGFRIVCECE